MCASSWSNISSRSKGRLIILLGVLGVTPDSMLLRFLDQHGVDSWGILVWKLLFMGVLTAVFTVTTSGGLKATVAGLKPVACYLPLVTVITGLVEVGFTLSVVHTTAANALLFMSLNPLWAALLAFFVLQERIPYHTVVSLVLALCGVLLIFAPVILGEVEAEEPRAAKSHLLGDVTALATGMVLAMQITLVRYLGIYKPAANLTAASAIGPFFGSLLALAMSQGKGLLPGNGGWDSSQPVWQYWSVLVADAACLFLLFTALFIAPALIPGPEVGLVMLLEAVVGPLWVLLAFGEVPSVWTFAGGAVLILALAANELLAMGSCFGRDVAKGDQKDVAKGDQKGQGMHDVEIQPSAESDVEV